tara:strand:- start:2017 stop:2154 length:138 start_codon:yes stop_codon:yes gene_type:complete
MLELFEPLMWHAVIWAFGVVTGLGIGVARTRDQMHREWRSEVSDG